MDPAGDHMDRLLDLRGPTSPDRKLFFCPSCGGVWWAVCAPMCSGVPTDGTGHGATRMQRANTVDCGNTPGLVVE